MQSTICRVLLSLIRAYQLVLSPLLGCHCRFEPSCSVYAQQAVRHHGALKGCYLTFSRLLKCRPGGGFGLDPVPETKENRPL